MNLDAKYKQKLRALSSSLEDERYAGDASKFHDISLLLCKLIYEDMTDEQKNAVDVAEKYWSKNLESADLLHQIDIFGDRIDNKITIDRLIWFALNFNTGLSSYAADFICIVALECGIKFEDIEDVFKAVVADM